MILRGPVATGLAVVAAMAVLLTGCGSTPTAAGSGHSAVPAPAPSATTPVPSHTSHAPVATAGAAQVWAGYHADQARTGAVPAMPGLDPPSTAWTADLGGAVYGQPVVGDGRIFAATENNRVVALSPATGRVLWSDSLGTPLTDVAAVAGCGDIDPLGVTSTPAFDAATDVVYVVGEVSDGQGSVHHQLEGIDAGTGAVVVSDDVDPPLPAGERAVNLLQRASLALADGRVYVPFGGNDGDCGNYHGWVVGVAQSGPPRTVSFEVASDGQGGAIWEAGGAPAVDAAGDLYVTTGNANPDPPQGGPDPKQFTESVVKLSPTLRPLASFKDEIAGGDEDLATGNPVLLPGGELFAVGKTDVGYVLRSSDLGRVAAISGICGSDPDGGPAFDAATDRIFVPCKGGGIQQVDLAVDKVGPRLPGANGAPVLIGATLWALAYPTGKLFEYDAATGRTVRSLDLGAVPTFATPSTGLGLILVGTRTGVSAVR